MWVADVILSTCDDLMLSHEWKQSTDTLHLRQSRWWITRTDFQVGQRPEETLTRFLASESTRSQSGLAKPCSSCLSLQVLGLRVQMTWDVAVVDRRSELQIVWQYL